MLETIETEITEFIANGVKERIESITPEDRLLEDGIIDSLSLLDLVTFIEKTYRVVVDDFDIDLETFGSVRSIWYCSPLRDRAPTRYSLPAWMAFELLEGESREELHEWLFVNRERYPWIYFPGEISSAVSNKHVYPIVRRGDAIIGFIKLGLRRVHVHDFESEISFPADVGFIYDTFVEPESRAKGVARSMLSLVSWLLRARGFRSLWCHVEDQNTASIKASGVAGFIRTGDVRYARLAWLRSWRINGRFTTQVGFENWLDEHSRRTPPVTADGLLGPIPPTSISDPRTPGR